MFFQFIIFYSTQITKQKLYWVQIILIKIAKNINDTTSFIIDDVKNPIKLPKAAFSAVFAFVLFKSSPIKAPINNPNIIPAGIGDNNPKIRPIVVPIIPALVPPNFLVPIAGIK